MLNSSLILLGKFLSFFSKLLGRGNGSTWPGHVALEINKNFIKDVLKNSKTNIILIAGTNGKTTTAKLISEALRNNGKTVIQNDSGANLLNGIASTILLHSSLFGRIRADFLVLEVDENSLPLLLHELTPNYLILLNLFRDQLDRYGEVNSIALKWTQAIEQLTNKTTLILNADDPQIAYFGTKTKSTVLYFGLPDNVTSANTTEHASDSTYCPKCNTKLTYKKQYYSHLGKWTCPQCKLSHPKINTVTNLNYPLDGLYNKSNTLAAGMVLEQIPFTSDQINNSWKDFTPAFGRQEKIEYHGKTIQLFLSKNPISFNQSLETVNTLKGKKLLIVLNDRIPDGRDVSWIWDIDFETLLHSSQKIHVSGDRAYDMALRIKYAHPAVKNVDTYPDLKKLFEGNVFNNLKDYDIQKNNTLFILPTYSAMLEIRKLITGKKIQ